MNTEYYEKLLEDVEDYIIDHDDSDAGTVLFRIRDLLRQIVGDSKSHNFKVGDIVSDGTKTLILLSRDPEYDLVIAYSALRNDVLLVSPMELVHYHKVGHMSPVKITIHNEEEK